MISQFITLLTAPFFQFMVLPLGASVIGIALKSISRPAAPGEWVLKREDLFIGLDLCLTACLLEVFETIKRAQEITPTKNAIAKAALANDAVELQRLTDLAQSIQNWLVLSLVVLLVFTIVLCTIAFAVQRWGWDNPHDQNTRRLRLWRGVVLPDTIGVVFLILATVVIQTPL